MFSLSDVQRSGHVHNVAADVTIIYNSPNLSVGGKALRLTSSDNRRSSKTTRAVSRRKAYKPPSRFVLATAAFAASGASVGAILAQRCNSIVQLVSPEHPIVLRWVYLLAQQLPWEDLSIAGSERLRHAGYGQHTVHHW